MKETGIGRLQLAIFFGMVFMAAVQLAACSSSSGDSRSSLFVSRLEFNGFIVTEGSADPIYPLDMVNTYVLDSAAGNNAGQPYKKLKIPVLPSVRMGLGIFQLRPYEAIVYLGPTPPMGDYFSFTPFLWVRHVGQVIPKGDWVFAALGDPLNHTQIKTEGGGSPFQKNTMVIFTADRAVYERIKAQAIAAEYPESMINAYVFPSELLNMGVNLGSSDDDSFIVLVRSANISDPKQENAYMVNDYYARIFRVTPDPAPQTLDPFPTPVPRVRKWQREVDLYPDLQAGLERLRNAILAQTPNLQSREFQSIRWWPDSRDVLEADSGSSIYHKFVAGEASDTPYRRTSQGGVEANFVLGDDDMVIAYGVNHAATGLAIYSNFSVYSERVLNPCTSGNILNYIYGCGDPLWNGVVGMKNREFAGSAARYLGADDPMAPYLYAVKVMRNAPADANDKFFVLVPVPDANGPASGIEKGDPVILGYRAYVNPSTGSGPDYDDIIPDRAIWFKVR
jgi:hypothetical protein